MKRRPEQLPLFSEVARETLSKYVKYLRGPYSQRELAEYLKVSIDAVENWEQGHTRPRPSQIRNLLVHYRSWALQQELASAAVHAAEAMGLKKDLTNPKEPVKQPVYPTELEH